MKRRKKAEKKAEKTPEGIAGDGREIFRHGGCEVLRLEYHIPPGEDAAARHAAALAAALCGFVRETLVREATEALEAAVREGRGYRFSHYVCWVNEKKAQKGASTLLSVTFEVRTGSTLLHQAVQESKWDTPTAAKKETSPKR